jgi:transcriptional regulator with XRE-family HTH domain
MALSAKNRRSIAWFAEKLFSGDEHKRIEAEADFQRELGLQVTDTFEVPRAEAFARIGSHPGVDFRSFLIPPVWGPSYTVLQAKVKFRGTSEKPFPEQFFPHSGEEYLYPTHGEIAYEFAWPDENERRIEIAVNASDGQAICISPNIPHHNRVVTDDDAWAWMVLRDLSGTRIPLGEPSDESSVDGNDDEEAGEAPTDEKGESDSDDTGRVIGEQIDKLDYQFWQMTDFGSRMRQARLRAGLTIFGLAARLDIHQTFLRRLERSEINAKLAEAIRIAQELGMDLSTFECPDLFPKQIESDGGMKFGSQPASRFDLQGSRPFCLSSKGKPYKSYGVTWTNLFQCGERKRDHWLHLHLVQLEPDAELKFAPSAKSATTVDKDPKSVYLDSYLGPQGKQSFVVIKGYVRYENKADHRRELLSDDTRPVIHLRNNAEGTLRAIGSVLMLHIAHAATCTCDEPPAFEKANEDAGRSN